MNIKIWNEKELERIEQLDNMPCLSRKQNCELCNLLKGYSIDFARYEIKIAQIN